MKLGGRKVGVLTRENGRMPEALIEYLITGALSCKLSKPVCPSVALAKNGQACRRVVPLHLYGIGKGYDYRGEYTRLTGT